MPALTFDTYGKTRVRLLQVLRGPSHEVVELSINVLFEGNLGESYIAGDNSQILPTDTMKNTIYVLARQHPIESIEVFGSQIGKHFLACLPHINAVNVAIDQTPWDRIGSHQSAFVQTSKERRVMKSKVARDFQSVICGLRNLQILKTSESAFFGYLKDQYTTLPETNDRLLGTVVDAEWTVSDALDSREFNRLHNDVRKLLLDCFATHKSLSVQHTLYAIGEAVLNRFHAIQDIHLSMPNKHCVLVDLSEFGLDNPNQIFIPTDEPSGLIEARLTR